MASPITPSTVRALSITPGARVLNTPLSDETIWKRLKDAGFDEESIKRRDKAALIAYIAKLETEIFDLQHHMGLLILERKEWASKYEQVKTSVEAAELMHKREQAALKSSLADARKREESLKKALGVEKECIASVEKALHEMRAESAETKVAAEGKLTEARSMMEDAQKKSMDAEAKLHAAEALQAEASQNRRNADRKLFEVEARESDLNRRISMFKADCDAKEKEIELERQTLSESRKVLQLEQERLIDGQASLNQREDYVASKSQELNRIERELEASKANIEKERRALNVEKSNLELTVTSISQREEAVIEREAQLNKREQELLDLREKMASKESTEIQKVIANHESILRIRKSEIEAELEMSRKLVDDEIEARRRAWELREVDLRQREEILNEREHDLEVKSRILADKDNEVTEKTIFLDEKERSLNTAEKETEMKIALIQQEKEEINKMKLDLQKALHSLEEKKKQVDCAKEKLENIKVETSELSALEMKLKEEVDMVRAQKVELMAEEERLKVEKAKFEAEWELIDEKREELRIEAERIAEEREAVSRLLKEERDSLRLEKEIIRKKHKRDTELLNREREEFMNKVEQERSEWFNKIQKEHADFLLGIEMQKRELENSIDKRREEVECYLRDQENAFELEKKNELQHISSLREKATRELEQVALEMKKLDSERIEINLDRERRDREWAVLNNSIEELKSQTQKLEKQRELLHSERDEVCTQIEQLKKLEDLKYMLDDMEVAKLQQVNMESSQQKISAIRYLRHQSTLKDADLFSHKRADFSNNGNESHFPSREKLDIASSPNSARFSWIRRCTELIFKNSPEKSNGKCLISNQGDEKFTSTGQVGSSKGYHKQKLKSKVTLAKGTHDKESEINEDDNEAITSSFSEHVLEIGRKRRVESSSLGVSTDLQPEQRKNNKRRKQLENDTSNAAKDANDKSVTPTKENAQRDLHSTEKAAEALIADRIIKMSEVTCEIADVDNFAQQEKLEQLLNSKVAGEGIIQDDGTNGNTNEGIVKNLLAHDSEASEMLKDQLGHDGNGADRRQDHIEASKTDDLRVEGSEVAKSNKPGKVTQDVGRITRSKQKL